MTAAEWRCVARVLLVLVALMHSCHAVNSLGRIATALEKAD
jgi:hypothetical protein